MPPSVAREHSPETALLLYCARTQVNEETAERIRGIVDNPIDWSSLIAFANEQMVLPLLHHTLSEVAPDATPSFVQEELRTRFRSSVRNNLLLAHELLGLLELFEKQDVPVVPFKGPVAAATVYGDLQRRPFVDLDLLVRTEDVMRAQTLLSSQQFEEGKPLPSRFDQPASWWLMLTEPVSKEQEYVRNPEKDIPIRVELHWDLAPRHFQHPLDPDVLWERLQTATLLDTQVRTFSPEDTLLYFCLHGTLHRWRPLRLVCDVAELLRRHPGLDWTWLLEEATRLRSKRLLLLALRLAHELLDAPLPASIRQRAYSHSAVASLAERVIPRVLRRSRDIPTYSRPWKWHPFAYYLQVRDCPRDGLGSCVYHLRQSLGYHTNLFSSLRKWWESLGE